MNDLDLCLEIVAVCYLGHPKNWLIDWLIASHSPLNISETVTEIEAWFQRTTNRKWRMASRSVAWLMTSRDPERSSRDLNMLRSQSISKTAVDYNTLLWGTVGYRSDNLASCLPRYAIIIQRRARGIAIASRPSVCDVEVSRSLCWNTSKIISWFNRQQQRKPVQTCRN